MIAHLRFVAEADFDRSRIEFFVMDDCADFCKSIRLLPRDRRQTEKWIIAHSQRNLCHNSVDVEKVGAIAVLIIKISDQLVTLCILSIRLQCKGEECSQKKMHRILLLPTEPGGCTG